MKYLYTILALLILSSCTAKTPVENNDIVDTPNSTETTATEETMSAIDTEIEELIEEKDEDMTQEAKMTKIEAMYKNPETEVDMVINYSLDEENKIKEIEVSATTYDLAEFNYAVQVVVGKTLEEAAQTQIAGGSLTNAAFKSAIK